MANSVSKSAEYIAYQQAKDRCCNNRSQWFKWYGGRGIQFKFKSFAQFMQELGVKPSGYCLDRIDTNGHYQPGNVRWVTRAESSRNSRRRPAGATGIRHISKIAKGYAAGYYSVVINRKPKPLYLYRGPSLEKAKEALCKHLDGK